MCPLLDESQFEPKRSILKIAFAGVLFHVLLLIRNRQKIVKNDFLCGETAVANNLQQSHPLEINLTNTRPFYALVVTPFLLFLFHLHLFVSVF